MDYEKKYKEALERAKKFAIDDAYASQGVVAKLIFPELRESESEDERIRKWILEKVQGYATSRIPTSSEIDMANSAITWLEEQKDKNCLACDQHLKGYIAGRETTEAEKQKEQKPVPTEDMPYITDEHFYEREPADSFKYKLAEYMTKCCTKKEGPYGYTYGISAESILKMAEEELLKRGVVQKPAEWSEEDEDYMNAIIAIINRETALYPKGGATEDFNNDLISWLKSLRPSWKPSEEQMEALRGYIEDFQSRAEAAVGGWNNFDVMIRLYEQLKKL